MNGLSKKIAFIVIALSAAVTMSAAAEEIYKWVDEEGVTHFAAQPPEGVTYERISGTSTPPASRAQESAHAEAEAPRGVPRMEVRETGPDAEALAEQCEQARNNLALLAERGPVMLRDEDGSETVLDIEARDAFAAENQAFIDTWC